MYMDSRCYLDKQNRESQSCLHLETENELTPIPKRSAVFYRRPKLLTKIHVCPIVILVLSLIVATLSCDKHKGSQVDAGPRATVLVKDASLGSSSRPRLNALSHDEKRPRSRAASEKPWTDGSVIYVSKIALDEDNGLIFTEEVETSNCNRKQKPRKAVTLDCINQVNNIDIEQVRFTHVIRRLADGKIVSKRKLGDKPLSRIYDLLNQHALVSRYRTQSSKFNPVELHKPDGTVLKPSDRSVAGFDGSRAFNARFLNERYVVLMTRERHGRAIGLRIWDYKKNKIVASKLIRRSKRRYSIRFPKSSMYAVFLDRRCDEGSRGACKKSKQSEYSTIREVPYDKLVNASSYYGTAFCLCRETTIVAFAFGDLHFVDVNPETGTVSHNKIIPSAFYRDLDTFIREPQLECSHGGMVVLYDRGKLVRVYSKESGLVRDIIDQSEGPTYPREPNPRGLDIDVYQGGTLRLARNNGNVVTYEKGYNQKRVLRLKSVLREYINEDFEKVPDWIGYISTTKNYILLWGDGALYVLKRSGKLVGKLGYAMGAGGSSYNNIGFDVLYRFRVQ